MRLVQNPGQVNRRRPDPGGAWGGALAPHRPDAVALAGVPDLPLPADAQP
jgi:hypothetical protein